MINIPTGFTEFLYWIREKTENYWNLDRNEISAKDISCEESMYGAKWLGLTEEQIDFIESKYNIKFVPEHREFLRILHAIDRTEKIELLRVAFTDEEIDTYETKHAIKFTKEHRATLKAIDLINPNDSEAEISDKGVIEIEERPYFYNWLTDGVYIEKYLQWPFETILADVLDKTWLRSWGERPETIEEKKIIFAKWYAEAPPLLPLTAHTFLISDPSLEYRPLLSVYGSDVIIAGWSLKAYLILHFADALGLTEMVYDEVAKLFYPEFKPDALTTLQEYFQFKLIRPIPYWSEMIMFYNWQFHRVDEDD